ncbi:NB-ARC domain-containing protein [Microcoleus sp.]|uniref:NB-ARC domain-containing protein n=1 Tax=Microcoleus sp. TaxID=44472 RepID=UPI003525EBBB
MKVENGIAFLDDLVYTKTGKRLNSLQKAILRGTWQNLKYPEIAKTEIRSAKYVKGVGFKLWNLLSEMLGEEMNQSNFRAVMEKTKLAIDLSNSATDFAQVNNIINNYHSCFPILNFPNGTQTETPNQDIHRQDACATNKKDLSEMPNLSTFYGRNQELTTLQKWILQEKCRLVTILGISGIGKTAIAIKLIQQIADKFDYIFWCSLRNKPSLDIIETNLLSFIYENVNTNNKPSLILDSLRKHSCLIILDDVQMLFKTGELAGKYESGYEEYASLFKQIGESDRNSCLVLLSGEKPLEIADLETENQGCKSLQLAGLEVDAAWEILKEQGLDNQEKWQDMINQYSGNPLWLKMVARIIQDLGLTDLWQQGSTFLFADLEYKLNQQFKRLSAIEKKVISTMANLGDRITITQILAYIPQSELFNALPSLLRRSYIEKNVDNGETFFTIQPVIKEYVKQQLAK